MADVQRSADRRRRRVDGVDLVARPAPIEGVGAVALPSARPLGPRGPSRRGRIAGRAARIVCAHRSGRPARSARGIPTRTGSVRPARTDVGRSGDRRAAGLRTAGRSRSRIRGSGCDRCARRQARRYTRSVACVGDEVDDLPASACPGERCRVMPIALQLRDVDVGNDAADHHQHVVEPLLRAAAPSPAGRCACARRTGSTGR